MIRIRPRLQQLDNECSCILKEYLRDENIQFQLVPPGMHRANSAERAIRTFKNHFIAGLCSVDPKFPLHLWDKLLDQAVLTLNLMRGSRINPKIVSLGTGSWYIFIQQHTIGSTWNQSIGP